TPPSSSAAPTGSGGRTPARRARSGSPTGASPGRPGASAPAGRGSQGGGAHAEDPPRRRRRPPPPGQGRPRARTRRPPAEGAGGPDEKGGAARGKALGAKGAYADYRAMLEKEKPQIVSVADRVIDQHRDQVVACARAGASVFLEKPMARTLAEADEMVKACE